VDEAIEMFRKAIALDPRRASFHTDLGLALESQGKWAIAAGSYRRAADLNPKNARVRTRLALSQRVAALEPKRDAELLRSLKTLETINDKPAAKFWKEVGEKKPGK
jgi:Flp pilus assembly protein TadD